MSRMDKSTGQMTYINSFRDQVSEKLLDISLEVQTDVGILCDLVSTVAQMWIPLLSSVFEGTARVLNIFFFLM